MSERELDLLYQRMSRDDPARPGPAVRAAILDEARHEARRLRRPRLRMRWPIAIAAPVAAAVLAALLLFPQLHSNRVAPELAREQATPSPSARAAPAALPPAPASAAASNLASNANLASNPNPASNADLASAESRLSSPPVQVAPAAPPAEARERRRTPARTARAPAASSHVSLQDAAARGDVALVRSLLQADPVSVNARDERGRTALLLAVLHGHEALVRLLLERGADPNIADAEGRTPLAIASSRNEMPIAESLLHAGAR